MKNFETARKIFYALNEKGAELGNASVVIIEDVLDKRDAALEAENKELRGVVKMAHTTMQAVRDEVPEQAYFAILTLLDGKWASTWDAVQTVLAKYEVRA